MEPAIQNFQASRRCPQAPEAICAPCGGASVASSHFPLCARGKLYLSWPMGMSAKGTSPTQ